MLTSIDLDSASELSFGCSVDLDENGDLMEIPYEFVSDEIVDRGRWEIYHLIVFRHGDDLYGFDYNEPATEYQEGSMDERFGGDPVPVFPMKGRVITTTVYEKA